MKKVLAVLFSIIAAFIGSGEIQAEKEYIEIGSYPQTRVESKSIVSELEKLDKEWVSFGYFSGNGSEASAKTSDYMKYADVELNGKKYRAVSFNAYRPMKTYDSHSSSSYQDDNGYNCNTVYWFEFEPLKWRILDKSKGLLMCESIIDSQPFNNTIYEIGGTYYSDADGENLACDYAYSSIREWLNNDFYNTAFSDEEKALINKNSCDQMLFPRNKGKMETVYDNVFMLSREEASDSSFGFNSSISNADNARRGRGTDYAKCQGLHVCKIGLGHKNNSCWWLRTPGYYSKRVNKIFYDGYCSVDSYYDVTLTDIGVRPCIIYNV